MTLAPVDWPLVLEFTKALAAPIAGLLAVVATAKLGIQAYTRQRFLERKTEWSEMMLRRLVRLQEVYQKAVDDPEKTVHAHAELNGVIHEALRGVYFVTASWSTALDEWISAVGPAHFIASDSVVSEDEILLRERTTSLCEAIVQELRRDYGVGSLDPLSVRIRARLVQLMGDPYDDSYIDPYIYPYDDEDDA